jgi:N-acetylglutamate synthase-like GNAT family acetyltransferase
MSTTEARPSRVYDGERDGFRISTDPARLDVDVIHGFLAQSYWAKGIPREIVERSIRSSLCFGIYEAPSRGRGESEKQIGFARVITDRATFAYLADVFVLEGWRGRGLSKWLLETILAHPDLQGLRRFCLGTRDAQGLYARYGFANPKDPSRWMEIVRPDAYRTG